MNPDLHLHPEALRRLQSGDLPPDEARRWAAHLAQECPECEAFLASEAGRALDAAADVALASIAPVRPEEAGNDLEFARILGASGVRPAPVLTSVPAAGTGQDAHAERGARRGEVRSIFGMSRRRATGFLAMAAVALLGAGVVFRIMRAPRTEWDGVKGPSTSAGVPASLRFAVVRGSSDSVERGASGQVVAPDANLRFRIEVGAPAHVALLRTAAGETEVIYQGHAARPGPVDVAVDGRPAAYSLRGLSGVQRFILVAGREPLTAEQLRAAATFLGGQAANRDPRSPELTVDLIEVTVR
jgi:hypothetical protein